MWARVGNEADLSALCVQLVESVSALGLPAAVVAAIDNWAQIQLTCVDPGTAQD
jgi:hypothetical protein